MGTKVDVAEIGKKGGETRASNMTAKQRSEAAKNASNARSRHTRRLSWLEC